MGREDSPEKEMATHCSILTWKNPMDGGAWQATVHGGHKESDTTELITLSLSKRHKNINIIHVPGEHQTVRDFFFGGGASKITADGL